MAKSAWDFMIEDDVYQLLEEYYGREVSLSDVLESMDKAAVLRLLDKIIEDCSFLGMEDEEMVKRARAAKVTVLRT